MKNAVMRQSRYNTIMGVLFGIMGGVAFMAMFDHYLNAPEVAVGYDGKPKYMIEKGVRKNITDPKQLPTSYTSFAVP